MSRVAARRRPRSGHVVAMTAAGVAVALAAGCSGSKDRAPPVSDCADLGCAPDASLGGANGSTGGVPGRTGGSPNATGGRGAGGAGGGRTVSGNVRIYADSAFDATTDFSAAGVVGLTGSQRAIGTFSAGQWSVSGADSTGTLWADMHATVMAGDALDTLQAVEGNSTDLVFAARSTFDSVVTGLSSVQSLNPDLAQIVLRFVDSAQRPIVGVVVAEPDVTVAYDAGSSYTDTKGAPFGATQQRGMAIIVNYTAVPFPGGPVTVQFVKPGATQATPVELRAANGAVTFRTVVAN